MYLMNGDVEMHDAGHVGCVDDREILLVCTCQRGQCCFSLLELGCGDVLLLATSDFVKLQVDARTWETRGDEVHFFLYSLTGPGCFVRPGIGGYADLA